MKKLIYLGLMILQSFTSFSQEVIKENSYKDSILIVDEFINAFYQTQNNPEEMIPFFDTSYYDTFYKFIEHMELKNKKCGKFLEKKIKSKKINSEGNVIRLKYRLKYKKRSMNDEIILHKNSATNKYKIYYWKTR